MSAFIHSSINLVSQSI